MFFSDLLGFLGSNLTNDAGRVRRFAPHGQLRLIFCEDADFWGFEVKNFGCLSCFYRGKRVFRGVQTAV